MVMNLSLCRLDIPYMTTTADPMTGCVGNRLGRKVAFGWTRAAGSGLRAASSFACRMLMHSEGTQDVTNCCGAPGEHRTRLHGEGHHTATGRENDCHPPERTRGPPLLTPSSKQERPCSPAHELKPSQSQA